MDDHLRRVDGTTPPELATGANVPARRGTGHAPTNGRRVKPAPGRETGPITYLHWLGFQTREVLLRHGGWMGWNLFLALVGLVLALVLAPAPEDGGPRRNGAWWLGAAAFALFLPNAPYVLTDLLHLRWSAQQATNEMVVVVAVVPTYIAFLATGMLAYVWCVELVVGEVHRVRPAWPRLAVVAVIHLWCSVGVVLGRMARLNSWNAFTSPTSTVERSVATLAWWGGPLAVGIVFVAITVAYVITHVLASAAVAWVRRVAPRAGAVLGRA